MKTLNTKNILFPLLLLSLTGCQPGAPVITALGEVSGFEINESIQVLKSKTSKSIFYISGRCFGALSDVQVSFDDGATYSPLSQYAETFSINCSTTGSFTYKINPNNTIAFDIPSNSAYKDFKIRGLSDFGNTVVKNLRRMISNSADLQITAGSTISNVTVSGTPAVLRGRIISSSGITTGPNYILKGSLRIK